MNHPTQARDAESTIATLHNRASHRSVIAILLLALIARASAMAAFLGSQPTNWLYSHPYEMGFLANSLVHGLGYSSPFGPPTGPTAFIAPGYPTLIAGIFLLFGSTTFASAIAIVSLQILVGVFTVWLIMHVASELFGARTAKAAGIFWALSIPLLYIPAIFWETSLSACSMIGIIALALRCRREPTSKIWIAMGAFCAVASLVNPALLPSISAIMAWTAFQTRTVSLKGPALAVLTALLLFAPWPIRNARRFHAFIPMRSTVGFEMYMGNRPGSTGRIDEKLFPMFNQQEFASYVSMGEVAYTRDKSQRAWAWIDANPGAFIKLSLRRAYRFWTGTGNLDGPAIYEVHALLTTLLGFTGIAFLYRRSRSVAVLFAIPMILFPFPYCITHAEFRYRLNIDPLMTVLAAFAAVQIVAAFYRHTSASRRSHLAPAAAE
jgi:hypothetical protein